MFKVVLVAVHLIFERSSEKKVKKFQDHRHNFAWFYLLLEEAGLSLWALTLHTE